MLLLVVIDKIYHILKVHTINNLLITNHLRWVLHPEAISKNKNKWLFCSHRRQLWCYFISKLVIFHMYPIPNIQCGQVPHSDIYVSSMSVDIILKFLELIPPIRREGATIARPSSTYGAQVPPVIARIYIKWLWGLHDWSKLIHFATHLLLQIWNNHLICLFTPFIGDSKCGCDIWVN